VHPFARRIGKFFHRVGRRPHEVLVVAHRRIARRVFPAFRGQLVQAAGVQLHRVRQNGQHDIALAPLVPLRHLDGREDVGCTGDADQVQLGDQVRRDTHLCQVLPAFGLVEQADELDRRLIVDRHDHIGVPEVVNPRHVFVADALDAMAAEPVE